MRSTHIYTYLNTHEYTNHLNKFRNYLYTLYKRADEIIRTTDFNFINREINRGAKNKFQPNQDFTVLCIIAFNILCAYICNRRIIFKGNWHKFNQGVEKKKYSVESRRWKSSTCRVKNERFADEKGHVP